MTLLHALTTDQFVRRSVRCLLAKVFIGTAVSAPGSKRMVALDGGGRRLASRIKYRDSEAPP
jgi:hypothetical protein